MQATNEKCVMEFSAGVKNYEGMPKSCFADDLGALQISILPARRSRIRTFALCSKKNLNFPVSRQEQTT